MVGVALVTVMDSSSVSSCSGPFTVAVALALTTTPSMASVRKLVSSKVTL